MILQVVLITGFHPILGMTEVAAVKGDEDLQVCSGRRLVWCFFAGAWFMKMVTKNGHFSSEMMVGFIIPPGEKCGEKGGRFRDSWSCFFSIFGGHKWVQRNW